MTNNTDSSKGGVTELGKQLAKEWTEYCDDMEKLHSKLVLYDGSLDSFGRFMGWLEGKYELSQRLSKAQKPTHIKEER